MANNGKLPSPATGGRSGFHDYSPIHTLSRQYATAGRVQLFVRCTSCVPPGGVETLMKLSTGGSGGHNHSSQRSDDTTSPVLPVVAVTTTTSATTGPDDNPFAFLAEDGSTTTTSTSSTASINDPAAAARSTKQSSKPNLGRFFKKVAQSTTQSLERGMTSLAIKYDQGRTPDLLVCGLYSDANVAWNFTESLPAPPTGHATNLNFAIPLELPASYDNGRSMVIKLWMRSGAATTFLQSKNYLVATVTLPAGQVRHVLQQKKSSSSRQPPCAFWSMPVQSAVLPSENAKMHLCIVPDTKLPTLAGRGWSAADPAVTGYAAPQAFHLTLDQSYGWTLPAAGPAGWLLATERTTESTVVLPVAAAWAQLASRAAHVSSTHWTSATQLVHANRHDAAVGAHANVHVQLGQLHMHEPQQLRGTAAPFVAAAFQRPDAIFEVELLHPTRIENSNGGTSFRFFPKPCRVDVLPGLLAASGGQLPPHGFCLGNLHMEVIIPFPRAGLQNHHAGSVAATDYGAALRGGEQVWDCVVSLDALLKAGGNGSSTQDYTLYSQGRAVGSIQLTISVVIRNADQAPPTLASCAHGLPMLVGLESVADSVAPGLDLDHKSLSSPQRQQQINTMGVFYTHGYMEQHGKSVRLVDCQVLKQRHDAYRQALEKAATTTTTEVMVDAYKDRSPRAFRPSSSRSEALLSGIPFNAHTATFSLNVLDPSSTEGSLAAGALFTNITCGAPADHARGFGNVFVVNNKPDGVGLQSPIGPVTGGLRRLELRRQDLGKVVQDLQTSLITGVMNYFVAERQQQHNPAIYHVPSRHTELQGLRWKLFEAVQSLHHVTWTCAVRRASVFSQSLGLALTSYFAALSDAAKLNSTWPNVWRQHGYLVSFEGLLSAAGKELGMIEDASVAIQMLNAVRVVLVPETMSVDARATARAPIVHSPFLRWLSIDASPSQSGAMAYTVQVGIHSSYFQDRIPAALRNVGVRFYSLLFEVGVDIRQWGAYAGTNVRNQYSSYRDGSADKEEKEPTGGLIDDEDDDAGVADEDVLVQLNYEALRKMNDYAQAISPSQAAAGGGGDGGGNSQAQRTHLMLEKLQAHVIGSAGKMNHDILDEAALVAQQLGGGGVVFCKSGKDRTAMHVTYKQSQFANKFRRRHPAPGTSPDDDDVEDRTLPDAMLMRVYGTRLPVCEKNVGQAKYAFNSLQVKFMPDALKPPMNTLAGFLKGGKVFSGSGIES